VPKRKDGNWRTKEKCNANQSLVPWNSRGREVGGRRDEEPHPILSLHREMNRLFEDVFRGFDLSPFSMYRWNGTTSWPRIEISESEKEVQVTAELPGLEETDIQVELEKGVLAIRGEKKTETEDKDRLFSERYYGRFERRIPLDDIDQDKIDASFKNGVLNVTLPKSPTAQQKVRRIAINGK
jgi:HSP20 family protein